MIPLRVIIDTNVVVSAALTPEGMQRTAVLLAMTKPARWYVSDAIVAEYAVVLAHPQLKIRRALRQQLLQLIENHTRVVRPSRLRRATSDAADNIFVECADAARADYLMTGNQRRFPAFWKNTKIVSSSQFLSCFSSASSWVRHSPRLVEIGPAIWFPTSRTKAIRDVYLAMRCDPGIFSSRVARTAPFALASLLRWP
jgi:putative PIN family toxin of toxin-antitoxin system